MAESSKIDRKKKHPRTSTQPFSAGDHPTRPARHSVPARGYQKCLWRQVVLQAVLSRQRTLACPAEAALPPSRPPPPPSRPPPPEAAASSGSPSPSRNAARTESSIRYVSRRLILQKKTTDTKANECSTLNN